MTPVLSPDLYEPFEDPRIVELRTSKMKTMRDLSISTGIYKLPRAGRVFCSLTGFESDEHDLTFHGGIDKAVLQYAPSHYPNWAAEFPERKDAFEVGGFGENLVCSGGMNERNVCIGDIYRMGGELELQVSLPRTPCFKLNHRFGIKGFAAQTSKTSRTGWYYRVLKEGWLQAGDRVVLVERKHPQWTVERAQEYIHRDKKNLEKLEELSKIAELGDEAKNRSKKLIASVKEEKEQGGKKEPEKWEEFEVAEKTRQTDRITSFVLKKEGGGNKIDPGHFVRLKLPNGLIRSYSIVGGTTHSIELGVALAADSRGGSKYLHHNINPGDKLLVGKITPSVPNKEGASHHIFIAGGIGITAFLSYAVIFSLININYEIHYAVRSAADIPFRSQVASLGARVTIYDARAGERMDIPALLAARPWNSHVYACGPQRMLDAVAACGPDDVHYEAFQLAATGDPFTVALKDGRTLDVAPERSLLWTLREAGLEVDSSCETGNCGTCRVEVCSGRVEHRGSGLGEADKGVAMLSCVSRGVGHLVIDF